MPPKTKKPIEKPETNVLIDRTGPDEGSSNSVGSLVPIIHESEGEKVVQKLNATLTLWGYNDADNDLIAFLTMILDDPARFKDVVRVAEKWTKPTTVVQMFCNLKKICKVPEIKQRIGSRFAKLMSEYLAFSKQVQEYILSQNPLKNALNDLNTSEEEDEKEKDGERNETCQEEKNWLKEREQFLSDVYSTLDIMAHNYVEHAPAYNCAKLLIQLRARSFLDIEESITKL